jgi:hypothetical protein
MTRIFLHARTRVWLLTPIVAAAAAFALHTAPVAASTSQVSLIQDGTALTTTPMATWRR